METSMEQANDRETVREINRQGSRSSAPAIETGRPSPVERQTEPQMPSTRSTIGPGVLIIVAVASVLVPVLLMFSGLAQTGNSGGLLVAGIWGAWILFLAVIGVVYWQLSKRSH